MIESFIVTVLVIYGIHATTREGMIFDHFKYISYKWLAKKTGFLFSDRLYKALFDCTPCMASVYGTVSFFIVVYPEQSLFIWPVWVLSLSGFNYLLNKMTK